MHPFATSPNLPAFAPAGRPPDRRLLYPVSGSDEVDAWRCTAFGGRYRIDEQQERRGELPNLLNTVANK